MNPEANTPCTSTPHPAGTAAATADNRPPACARRLALAALAQVDPATKVQHTLALHAALRAGTVHIDPSIGLQAHEAGAPLPGRPPRPELLPPGRMAWRNTRSREGRAALLHAIAHIEFNAINLALDAAWRFPGLPANYYRDWLRVAAEEAEHFTLLREHLQTQGADYGDFPAHNGLWEMAEKTADDLLARMALVPRTLEARGLDANPGIRAKLAAAGDAHGAEILDRILADEIGHVAIGNRWYHWACAQASRDPLATYDALARQYAAPRLKPPFNREARLQAGFTSEEMAWLEGQN